MYVGHIEIRALRCIRKAELELCWPGKAVGRDFSLPNVNLVLGNNGSGKTSVLKAIAIGLLGFELVRNGFVAYRLVSRPGFSMGQVMVKGPLGRFDELKGKASQEEIIQNMQIVMNKSSSIDNIFAATSSHNPEDVLGDENSSGLMILGYGASRRTEVGDFSSSSLLKLRGPRYQRVASLFEDQVALRPLQAWLSRLDREELRVEAIEMINAVLPEEARFAGAFDDKEDQYLFEIFGRSVPFAALSDGYRAFIGWVGDLLGHLCDVCPPGVRLAELEGIVLVDEIDLNLHPSWQRRVLPSVARAFPRLQFVVTSHSPLVASSVQRENIFVAETDAEGWATVRQYGERSFGRSADDLLMSDYFGLPSPRAENLEPQLEALAKRTAIGDADDAVEYLRRLGLDPEEPAAE